MSTFCSPLQDRLIRLVQPRRAGGKMLSVPQIKLVRHDHYHTKLTCAHARAPPHINFHSREAQCWGITALLTRNANHLLQWKGSMALPHPTLPFLCRFFSSNFAGGSLRALCNAREL